jgi:hypothetical protein
MYTTLYAVAHGMNTFVDSHGYTRWDWSHSANVPSFNLVSGVVCCLRPLAKASPSEEHFCLRHYHRGVTESFGIYRVTAMCLCVCRRGPAFPRASSARSHALEGFTINHIFGAP